MLLVTAIGQKGPRGMGSPSVDADVVKTILPFLRYRLACYPFLQSLWLLGLGSAFPNMILTHTCVYINPTFSDKCVDCLLFIFRNKLHVSLCLQVVVDKRGCF